MSDSTILASSAPGRLGQLLGELGRGLRDAAFPPSCVACGGLVEPEISRLAHVCHRCEPLIKRVHAPHCDCCGHPFFGEISGERICPHCEGLRPVYGRGKTCILMKGPARALVHALKYHHGLHVLADVEAILRDLPEVLDFVRGAVLVPVPMHARKVRERGYNQSELIAEAFARAAGGETRVARLLVKAKDTVSQTHYDRAARRRNLKNAFALAPGTVITAGFHHILVDDVFTTGSTLNACSDVLRQAGALSLDVVTFGHG